jgi:U3 small nucleolar RNA-associated protein 18
MAPSQKRRKKHSPLVEGNSESNTEKRKKDETRNSKIESKDDIEERRLTSLLFGGEFNSQVENTETTNVIRSVRKSNQQVTTLFEIDTKGDLDGGDDIHELRDNGHSLLNSEVSPSHSFEEVDEKPIWNDDDDAEVDLLKSSRLRKLRNFRDEEVSNMKVTEMERRLRKRLETTAMTNARTDWAKIGNEVVEDTLATPLLAKSTSRLPPQILQVVRCPDANQSEPNKAAVQVVNFYPHSDPDRPLMLTAGLDKTLRFFQVDSNGSDKVHGIFFPKLPIYSAQFLGDTGSVVVSGRRSFFYIYDTASDKLDLIPRIMGREEKSLEKFITSPDGKTIAFLGNDGYIILVEVKSRNWIGNLKMNGSVRSLAFTKDSSYLLASGSDGEIYRFDMRTMRCVDRFSNEDGTITSSLSMSSNCIAVGAESGVVNLYQKDNTSSHKPIKSLMNLKTAVDLLKFNHDGQILAFSTRREKMGLRLLHVPSMTVFSNWPTSKTPLSYSWSLDFSPQSKFMAVGNDKGVCLLYKLLHYYEN